ncbi:hypothetical protein [Pseudomonas nitroreducens]|uniref:hypothetical protein n=1 Tax=Pseudomonas nitroreducens TaxID=46680 RepID=UPI00265AFB4E|nr:hypothetical protein [Pseudomonas nitroreducens]MCP1652356.1 hypothetical protein [Pseudomonas nitroreducens]MCP1689866.1 hypothetical protein [Pseudomonas nitroreducens]
MMKRLFAAVVLAAMSVPAFAETGPNVFLNGKVIKGDEVVASFAMPARLGSTVPVKDQVLNSYIESALVEGKKVKLVPGKIATGLDLEVTPSSIAGDRVMVMVKGTLAELNGFDKAPVAGTDLHIDLPKLHKNEFSQTFSIKNGQPLEYDFGGSCTSGFLVGDKLVDNKPADCTHKLILEASVYN